MNLWVQSNSASLLLGGPESSRSARQHLQICVKGACLMSGKRLLVSKSVAINYCSWGCVYEYVQITERSVDLSRVLWAAMYSEDGFRSVERLDLPENQEEGSQAQTMSDGKAIKIIHNINTFFLWSVFLEQVQQNKSVSFIDSCLHLCYKLQGELCGRQWAFQERKCSFKLLLSQFQCLKWYSTSRISNMSRDLYCPAPIYPIFYRHWLDGSPAIPYPAGSLQIREMNGVEGGSGRLVEDTGYNWSREELQEPPLAAINSWYRYFGYSQSIWVPYSSFHLWNLYLDYLFGRKCLACHNLRLSEIC